MFLMMIPKAGLCPLLLYVQALAIILLFSHMAFCCLSCMSSFHYLTIAIRLQLNVKEIFLPLYSFNHSMFVFLLGVVGRYMIHKVFLTFSSNEWVFIKMYKCDILLVAFACHIYYIRQQQRRHFHFILILWNVCLLHSTS